MQRTDELPLAIASRSVFCFEYVISVRYLGPWHPAHRRCNLYDILLYSGTHPLGHKDELSRIRSPCLMAGYISGKSFLSRELMPVVTMPTFFGLQSSASSALIHSVYTQYISKSFYLKLSSKLEWFEAPTSGG